MQKLEIISYTPSLFDKLMERVSTLPADYPLRCRTFVDYYYASSQSCELYIALDSDGAIAGFQGVERMPFVEDDRKHVLGFGSNFYAFKPGAGTYLLLNWIKTCDAGLVFGGSADMNRLIDKAKWSRYTGMDSLLLNRRYEPAPENGWLRMTLKKILKHPPFRTPLRSLDTKVDRMDVSVAEVSSFTPDLLSFSSAFRFRVASDLDYLNWRYGPQVPFLRYRIFNIKQNGRQSGFVVLLDNPKNVVVAHADGSDRRSLATGIILSISAMAEGPRDKREVLLVTTDAEMRAIYERTGFRSRSDWNRPLAIGKVPGGYKISAPVSEWMVSFGWGDNAVRPPFRDGPRSGQTGTSVAAVSHS